MSSITLKQNTYIKNTYLYVCIALVILALSVYYLDTKKTEENTNQMIVFIFGLLCIISIYSIENKLINHIFWVLFIVSMGYMLYPLYKEYKKTGIFYTTLITTALITLVISFYALKTNKNFSGWGKYLFFGLLAFILFQIVDLFFNKNVSVERNKMYGYIGVILFSMFLLYDTNRLKLVALYDKNPMYTRTSLSLFLDIINLFTSLGRSR